VTIEKSHTKSEPRWSVTWSRTGLWWKFNDYSVDGERIRPAPGAELTAFDPWALYAYPRVQHGVYDTPYLAFLSLAATLKAEPPQGTLQPRTYGDEFTAGVKFDLSAPAKASVLLWCRQFGLLGIQPLRDANEDLFRKIGRGAETNDSSTFSPKLDWVSWKDAWSVPFVGDVINSRDDSHCKVNPLRPDALNSVHHYVPHLNAVTFDQSPVDSRRGRYSERIGLPGDPRWQRYSEAIEDFCVFAWQFHTFFEYAVHSKLSGAEWQIIRRYLDSLLAPTETARTYDNDSCVRELIAAPSLLCHFALMFLDDLNAGRRFVKCDTCSRWLVAEDPRAKYCSARCRRTMMMRNYRSKTRCDGE
jgi:hypothetical protein